MGKGRRAKKDNSIIKRIIIAILIIILIFSIAYLIIYFKNYNENKDTYTDLEQDILLQVNSGFIDKVKELQQENSDVKGWVKIPETNINYPLLQTTDNDYYMAHNYKKENSKYGSIFINSNCNIKDINSNVIIYGHNMNDPQMFNELLKYEDKTFYETHNKIQIVTELEESEYEIVCVFKSRVFYKDEVNVFRYYQYYSFENESKYNEYLNNCRKIQLYDTGVSANYGEQLITLITCEYSQENGRIVVVARKI